MGSTKALEHPQIYHETSFQALKNEIEWVFGVSDFSPNDLQDEAKVSIITEKN